MKAASRPAGPAALLIALGVNGCGEPPPEVTNRAPESPSRAAPRAPLFVASDALVHRHFSGATGAFLFPEILGSGVALIDFDGDGDLDVYLIQGNALDGDAPTDAFLLPLPAGQPPGNRLLRNELVPHGELSFADVTDAAGVGLDAHGMGVAVGDIDNDGDPDLYVTNLGDNALYRNNGDGTFSDVTKALSANLPSWSTSAAFCDYDRDGDLDLYVTSYVVYTLRVDQRCTSASGNRDYCGPQNYQNAQDHLLRNDGGAGFVDVSGETGIGEVRGPGLGVTCADFDGDNDTDIFVANDGEANHIWMNNDGESFEEMGLMSGTAFNRDGLAEASMGVSAGDFDGDGDEDLFMTHLVNETNTLYANDGSGAFTDVTDRAGLGFGSKSRTGFGSAWFDFDNDGWLDLYIANGDVKVEELRERKAAYPFDQPNQLYRNLGGGRFEEVDGGDATGASEISRGVAFGDIDNDGDTDFVVTNNSGPARLMLNQSGNDSPWLRLQLVGTTSNRDAYGARVALIRDDHTTLWRRVYSDGSYLSASDPRIVFGLDDNDQADVAVGVHWPSGERESFRVPVGAPGAVLVEGEGVPWPLL